MNLVFVNEDDSEFKDLVDAFNKLLEVESYCQTILGNPEEMLIGSYHCDLFLPKEMGPGDYEVFLPDLVKLSNSNIKVYIFNYHKLGICFGANNSSQLIKRFDDLSHIMGGITVMQVIEDKRKQFKGILRDD